MAGDGGIDYWVCGCCFSVVVGSRLREKETLMAILFLEWESEGTNMVVLIPVARFLVWSSCEECHYKLSL